jgi:hypothetical protein
MDRARIPRKSWFLLGAAWMMQIMCQKSHGNRQHQYYFLTYVYDRGPPTLQIADVVGILPQVHKNYFYHKNARDDGSIHCCACDIDTRTFWSISSHD